MKVLMRISSMGAGVYISAGIQKAMRNLGHDVLTCQGGEIHKMIHEFQPDLFIGSISFPQDFDATVLNMYPDMDIVLWAHQYNNEKVPKYVLPANTMEREVNMLRKINNIKAVISHFGQEGADKYLSRWKDEEGYDIISMPPAADIHNYYPCEPMEEYKCQLGYVGGYWPKKAAWCGFLGLDAYLFPLHKKYDFKIYGWGWPAGYSLGVTRFGYDKYVFNSCQVAPNLHEPHSRYLGVDVVERTFKLPACKTFQIVDNVEEVNNYFNDEEIVMAQDVKDYHEKVDYYLKHPEEREPFVEKAYKRVMKDHKYEDRIKYLFSKLGGRYNAKEAEKTVQE